MFTPSLELGNAELRSSASSFDADEQAAVLQLAAELDATPIRAKVRYLKSKGEGALYEAEWAMAYDFPNSDLEGQQEFNALETIYMRCQNDFGFLAARDIKTRSLSCGDIVTLDGQEFLCTGNGWMKLPANVAEWVLENITPRDFCHKLETIIRLFRPRHTIPDFVAEFANL